MDKAKSISTLMHPSQVLDANEEEDKVSDKLHRGMINSLLYLTPSRLDIQLSGGIVLDFNLIQNNHT